MIVIPRDLARRFRVVGRKCGSGRPRGPAAPVVLQSRAGALTLWTRAGEVELVHTTPAVSRSGDETLVVPMTVLEAVEGATGEPVELAVDRKLRGTARWSDRGTPRTMPFDAVLPGKQHRVPDPPGELARVAPEFLAALHECGRTAAREATRFALDRVQVRGRAGQVVGTDGRQALLWGGLRLPFADDVLVPATPVFGAPELAGQPDVRVGRTASHLVVAAGPWAVRLPADPGGRYPDVAAVVPRPPAPSVTGIDGRDAQALLAALPNLPGAGESDRPVTLELDGGVVVRAKDGGAGAVRELYLARSPAAGPPARVALDRAVLARVLTLGCHTVRLASDGKPLVAEGDERTFVALPLDPSAVVMPTPGAARTSTAGPARPGTPTTSERRIDVKARPRDANGHDPAARPGPPPADGPDPLAEAEGLRAALADAAQRAGRLVAALKQTRREKQALSSVWSRLRSLNIGR